MNYCDFQDTFCKKCIHWQHRNHNIYNSFKCDLETWDCENKYDYFTKKEDTDILPDRYEKDTDENLEKKEREKQEAYARSYKAYQIGIVLGYVFIGAYILEIAFLIVLIGSTLFYGFTNDNATFFQAVKYSVVKHSFMFWFVIIKEIPMVIIDLLKGVFKEENYKV